MKRTSSTPMAAVLIALLVAAESGHARAPDIPEVVTVQPTPGWEDDYFRFVDVFVRVDFDSGQIEVEGDPDDETNVLCGVPSIVFPPNGTGLADAKGSRPNGLASQLRWIVTCLDGTDSCLGPDDLVLIRPKADEADPACAPAPRRECDFPRNASVASKAQQRTMFSPASSGTMAIRADCTGGACRPGSLTSGIPNPVFPSGVTRLVWSYQVELWRDGVRVSCLDPDVCVQDDGCAPCGLGCGGM